MSLIIKNNNESGKGFSTKDKIIVLLSVISLAILIFLVVSTRKNNQMLTEVLTTESTNSSTVNTITIDDNPKVVANGLILTEVCGDKWIEFYNDANDNIDISGYTVLLSGEKVSDIKKGTIAFKDEYCVVELDKNPGEKGSNLLSIYDNNGKELITIMVPLLSNEQSYGRRSLDSYELGYVMPSKGTDNPFEDYYSMVYYGNIGFSVPGGFYDSEFDLRLSAGEGKTIYYTTDGTQPTTESTKYEAPIRIKNNSGSKFVYAAMAFGYASGEGYYPDSIDMGTVLRAICVDSKGNTIGETVQSYYIGLSKDSDYSNIAVLSVTADPEALFDYFEGIYVPGRTNEDGIAKGYQGLGNYLNGWVRKGYVEYFEPGKGKSFEADVLMSISRDNYAGTQQKSFTLALNEGDYTAFKGSSIAGFINQDNHFRLTSYYGDSNTKLRELLINSLANESGFYTADLKPCVVFINGEYWGLYMLRQYYDGKSIEQKYDVNGKEIEIFNNNDYSANFEDTYNYVVYNDMSNTENYETIKKMVDIESYLRYMCINLYVGNTEFNSRTSYVWRTNGTGSGPFDDHRWRWTLGNEDNTLNLSAQNTYSIDTYLFKNLSKDAFFQSLLMNTEFCESLENTMSSMKTEFFTDIKWTKVLNEYVSLIKKPSLASSTRFYGNMDESFYMADVKKISEFMENREEYIIRYTKEVIEAGGDVNVIRKARNGTLEEELSEEKTESQEELEPGEENNEG